MLVLAIQPINLVAPGALILMVDILIADSGSVELLASVQIDQMGFQLGSKLPFKKIFT